MKHKFLSLITIFAFVISLTLIGYQYKANLNLKRELGTVYASSIANIDMIVNFMLDYLSNDKNFSEQQFIFYTTKLNELKVANLPPNSPLISGIGPLYSRFHSLQFQLKNGNLQTKNNPEFEMSLKISTLLKSTLTEIKLEYNDSPLKYYKYKEPNNTFANNINSEFTHSLMDIMNGK